MSTSKQWMTMNNSILPDNTTCKTVVFVFRWARKMKALILEKRLTSVTLVVFTRSLRSFPSAFAKIRLFCYTVRKYWSKFLFIWCSYKEGSIHLNFLKELVTTVSPNRGNRRSLINRVVKFSLISSCLIMVFLLVGTPRDGNWGSWSGWTNCSRACNGGTRIRYRFCDSPSPLYGGKVCEGERLLEEPCNEEPCPRKLYNDLFTDWVSHKGNICLLENSPKKISALIG